MRPLLKIIVLIAIVLTGLSAGVAFAHLLELPNKMQLSATDYLLVQQRLYEGFGQVLGPIELGALLSAIAFTILSRKHRLSFRLGAAGAACIAAALVVWQLHNGPANEAVDAWRVDSLPANWRIYRDRWEYAHAARAGLYILGLGVLILAVLSLDARHHSDCSPLNRTRTGTRD